MSKIFSYFSVILFYIGIDLKLFMALRHLWLRLG